VPLQPMSVHTVDMPSPPPSCEHNYSFMSIPPTPKMTEKTEKSGFKLLKKHLLEQDDVCDENVITAILDTITSNSVSTFLFLSIINGLNNHKSVVSFKK
jgi:hypothetical protein